MDGPGTITWEEFLENAESLVNLSNKISDGWEFKGNKNIPGQAYISRRKKYYIPGNIDSDNYLRPGSNSFENDLNFEVTQDPFEAPSTIEKPLFTEHHILWSMSYGVPTLYFNGWKSDFPDVNLLSVEEAQLLVSGTELKYTELSQAIHPVLGTPFLHLHPCMSRELLQVTNKSKNKLVSWLSTVAPAALCLQLSPEYCQLTL